MAAQEARIVAWASAMGCELVDVFRDEGVSGSRADNRPGLQSAIASACKAGAALVVYSLSRLCRSTRDAISISEKLDKNGADLVSLSERLEFAQQMYLSGSNASAKGASASGKMVFRMLAVLSEFERDQISERTKAALAHKKSLGQRVGQIPFGKKLSADGITLEDDDTEQHVLSVIKRLHLAGYSQRKLVAALNRRGFLTKSGKAWNRNSLRSVLRGLSF